MKAQEGVRIHRTQNDTDDISVILSVIGDAGTTLVADASTVTLHVAASPTVSITGTAKGDASGTFTFDPSTIGALTGTFDFEVQVDDATDVFTIGRGRLISTAELA